MKYRLLINAEVVDYLETLPGEERRLLRRAFVAIAADPRSCADYVEPDLRGRPCDVCVFHSVAIKYWEDSADRDLKILEVVPADRE